MTILDLMESINEFGKRKVDDWWDSGEILIQKVQSCRDSTADKLYPCLRVPLLALIDAANLCIFGVGLSALIVVGLFLLCSFILLIMAPFLVVASWLSSYVLPPVDRPFHPSLWIRHTIFSLASMVLFGILYLLNKSMERTNPESNLKDFLINYVESLPTLPWIGVTYALWTGISVYCVVFTFDFTLAVGWGFFAISYLVYYFFLFCFMLVHHIPWFVLLPLAIFLSLFVFSLVRRVNTDPNHDGYDDEDNNPERIFGPFQSTYGTV